MHVYSLNDYSTVSVVSLLHLHQSIYLLYSSLWFVE